MKTIPESTANYWLTEPATDVDPALIARRPSFGTIYIYYHGTTSQALGMIRKVPPGGFPGKPRVCGSFRTAWFSGDQIETKSHWGLDAAKKFLQRKFTRTVGPTTRTRTTTRTILRSANFQTGTLDRLAA